MPSSQKEIAIAMTKAKEARRKNEFNQAVSILNDIIRSYPNYAPAYREAGSILMHSQSRDKALLYIDKSIELDPNDRENYRTLATYYLQKSEWKSALIAYQKILDRSPRDTTTLYDAMTIHRDQNNLGNVSKILELLLEIEPDNRLYLWDQAKLLVEMNREKEALEIYESLLSKSDTQIEVIAEWCELMHKCARSSEVSNYTYNLYRKYKNNLAYMLLYAVACFKEMHYGMALEIYKEALQLSPNNAYIYINLGSIYKILNSSQKAEECFIKALEIDPLNISLLDSLSQDHDFQYGDSLFKRLHYIFAYIDNLSDYDKVVLHNIMGKAYDSLGDYDIAFEHYRVGGAIRSNGKEKDDLASLKNRSLYIKNTFTKERLEQNNQKGCKSDKPIFIVGMPRSGSTLTEQVLDSIDGIYGAGELKYTLNIKEDIDDTNALILPNLRERGEAYVEYLESIAPPQAKHIINKMPSNFTNLGDIHLMLPNASIIHTMRHPIEICLSAYRINFDNEHYWTDDLRTMGKYYRLYSEVMNSMKSILPQDTILEVRYEDMIRDLESESKRITDYLGVEWSSSCLEFHNSSRAVNTASISQVRKPLYTTSTNRWGRYERHLKPLIDEIGDLVEAYEKSL